MSSLSLVQDALLSSPYPHLQELAALEDSERRMHSDFVAGDEESMSEGEGAEAPQAMYARQQIDAAAALFDMPRAAIGRPSYVGGILRRPSRPGSAVPSPSRPGSAVPSRPASAVPSPMRRPSSALHPMFRRCAARQQEEEPTAEEEAMADEAQQFAEDTHAATAVQGAVEPPLDHISVQEFVDNNNTFDEVMQDIEAENFEAMLPPTYDGHD